MLIKLDALKLVGIASTSKPDKLNVPVDCLHVTEDGDIVATNGHILLKMRGNVEEPGLFDAEFDTSDREQKVNMLITGSVVRDFLACCRQSGKEAPTVVLTQKRKSVNLATTDGVTTKRFDASGDRDIEKFPDASKLLGKRVERVEVTLGVDVLMQMLRTLRAVGCKSVTLGVPPVDEEQKQIVDMLSVDAKATNGQVTGAVMPMLK